MPVFTDQTGRNIELHKTPARIISLVPSQTELLYDLGLTNEVVGITKFCVHPDEWFRSKTRVGGTKELKPDIIRQLKPDLVIANKEENVREQIEDLANDYPVWVSDVNNLGDAYAMIEQIGILTDKKKEAQEICVQIEAAFSRFLIPDIWLPTAYLIWQNPYMTVGGDTFIHSMMDCAGFDNIFAQRNRYPEVTPDELAGCQLLFLSSEPFPFKEKHIEELQPLLPNTKILLVDGEMFSWYGSRLLHAPEYFNQLRRLINFE